MVSFHPFDVISFPLLFFIGIGVLGFMAIMVHVGLIVIRKKQ